MTVPVFPSIQLIIYPTLFARNFGRSIAGGSAGNSDHGRDLVKVLESIVLGEAPDYTIRDEKKLLRICRELGIDVEGPPVRECAHDLAKLCFDDFGSRKNALTFTCRVPAKRLEIWEKYGIMSRGIEREIAEIIEKARDAGASGINVGGLCCTGNELLARKGIPMAGNHLMTELAIVTGAVEAVVVDYQCIMPGMVQAASCYHTRFITTSEKGRFTGATHVPFNTATGYAQAKGLVEMAIAAYENRDDSKVEIPGEPVDMTVGFSNEALIDNLGGSLAPLLDAVKSGAIRGVAAIVGCSNPRFPHDSLNVGLAKELIQTGDHMGRGYTG